MIVADIHSKLYIDALLQGRATYVGRDTPLECPFRVGLLSATQVARAFKTWARQHPELLSKIRKLRTDTVLGIVGEMPHAQVIIQLKRELK